jgi:N-acyl-D-amino-acid deacylase
MSADMIRQQSYIQFDPAWTTLGEYMDHMVERGITPNIASYVGATTARIHVLGEADRAPKAQELAQMQDLVRQAMREGALGVGSSLIYAPAAYAQTDADRADCRRCRIQWRLHLSHALRGSYRSHRRTRRHRPQPVRVYNVSHEARWRGMGPLRARLARLNTGRAEGIDVTANVYTYLAGATGLDSSMPPWVQEGGHDAWVARLRDPAIRARVLREMRAPAQGWENLYQLTRGPQDVILIGFRNPELRGYTGQTLAQVAAARGTSPEDTIIDLVIADNSRVDTAYVLMSEEHLERNLRCLIRKPARARWRPKARSSNSIRIRVPTATLRASWAATSASAKSCR